MVADDANAKHKDIARLYPGSEQIWVDSGHDLAIFLWTPGSLSGLPILEIPG